MLVNLDEIFTPHSLTRKLLGESRLKPLFSFFSLLSEQIYYLFKEINENGHTRQCVPGLTSLQTENLRRCSSVEACYSAPDQQRDVSKPWENDEQNLKMRGQLSQISVSQ